MNNDVKIARHTHILISSPGNRNKDILASFGCNLYPGIKKSPNFREIPAEMSDSDDHWNENSGRNSTRQLSTILVKNHWKLAKKSIKYHVVRRLSKYHNKWPLFWQFYRLLKQNCTKEDSIIASTKRVQGLYHQANFHSYIVSTKTI